MDYVTLQKLCKRGGTTPTGLVKKLGMSPGNLWRWKRGVNPSMAVATRMCEELDCTLDELMGIEKPAAPEGEQPEPTERQQLMQQIDELTADKSVEALKTIIGMIEYIESKSLK